jgi:hypothetical protein
MEAFKVWHVLREGIKQTIKQQFPEMDNGEVNKFVNEIEKECRGKNIEEVVGCMYRKIGEKKKHGEERRIQEK